MTLASNQPYFMPYLAYWQLIAAADLFLVGDDYNYIRHGWISHNRILLGGAPCDFGISVKGASSNKLISEMEVAELDAARMLKKLQHCYGKAPYFADTMELMERIMNCPERNLSLFLTHSIKEVCRHLGITTQIGTTSQFDTYGRLKKEERIYEYCRQTGADTYINPIGGQALYSFEEFRKRGITLKFINSQPSSYCQRVTSFVPGLSIIDVMMFNSREQIAQLLQQYTWIEQ